MLEYERLNQAAQQLYQEYGHKPRRHNFNWTFALQRFLPDGNEAEWGYVRQMVIDLMEMNRTGVTYPGAPNKWSRLGARGQRVIRSTRYL